VTALLPDGVASISLLYPATATEKAIERTIKVRDNVVSYLEFKPASWSAGCMAGSLDLPNAAADVPGRRRHNPQLLLTCPRLDPVLRDAVEVGARDGVRERLAGRVALELGQRGVTEASHLDAERTRDVRREHDVREVVER
jgi:hypothetical protein